MSTITLAQLGCGYWGPNLLRNFSALPGCVVKYVVEPRAERRAFVEANYPRSIVQEDAAVVFDDRNIDGVVVATPAATHFELARRALEAGKHVLVEKPLASTVSEVDQLTDLAAVRGLTLMVGHTFLYSPAVAYLRDLIVSGELGDICYVYTQRLNLGVIRSDVDAMWNLAPHDISIIDYLLDATPTRVSAIGSAYIQRQIADVVFINIHFATGVLASIHVSWLDPNKVRRITIVGTRKMIVYDDVANDKVAVFDKGIDRHAPENPFDDVAPTRLVHRSGDIWFPQIDGAEPIRVEAAHFLNCIRTGARPRTDGASGRRVIAVLEAATCSLTRHGAPIEMCEVQGV